MNWGKERYIEREREVRFCLKSSSLLEINSSVAYHTRLQFTKTHKLNNGTFDLLSSQNRPKYFYFATLCKQQVVRTFFLTIIKYDPCNFKALLCNYFLQSHFLYDKSHRTSILQIKKKCGAHFQFDRVNGSSYTCIYTNFWLSRDLWQTLTWGEGRWHKSLCCVVFII